ncbi:MAG: hypothetical protein ABIB46_02505 [bacterium]
MSSLWIILFTGLYSIFKKKYLSFLFKNILLFAIFISTVVFSFTFPIKIKKNTGLFLTDTQSHTFYSWDGLYSPEYNRKWHKNNGYDFNYITDHWNYNAKRFSSIKNSFHDIFFGMETALNGAYYLINEEISQLSDLEKIINEGKAISLFYWNNKNLKTLKDKSFYGYEIYNQGHPQFSLSKRVDFLNEIKLKKIKVFAGTDWHGYLSFSWCWTVIETDNKTLNKTDIDKFIYSFEENNSSITTRVILYGKTIVHKIKPSFFEPFRSLFIYFTGLDIKGIISWYIFFCLIIFLQNKKLLQPVLNFIFLIWFIRLFFLGLIFRTNYLILIGKNLVLNDLSSFLLIFSGIFIFYFFSKIFDKFYYHYNNNFFNK